MCELYAADEEDFPAEYPLSYADIAYEQGKGPDIQKVRIQKPERYVTKQRMFAGKSFQLVTREGKIVLPKSLTKRVVEWYHKQLCHPGETQMELTMGQHYCWKGMRNTVKQIAASVNYVS